MKFLPSFSTRMVYFGQKAPYLSAEMTNSCHTKRNNFLQSHFSRHDSRYHSRNNGRKAFGRTLLCCPSCGRKKEDRVSVCYERTDRQTMRLKRRTQDGCWDETDAADGLSHPLLRWIDSQEREREREMANKELIENLCEHDRKIGNTSIRASHATGNPTFQVKKSK